jgi:undecaprenyl-diphosphatase
LVLISFVVTAVPAFLMDKFVGDFLEGSFTMIGLALLIGGVAMYAVDHWFGNRSHTETIDQITLRQAVAIGLAQILAAAFPGTSRSMATIAGGQVMGLSRSAALEFSFFLSIPVMFAAAGFKLLQHLRKEVFPTGEQWVALSCGFVTSFLVALVVIAWFMHWVRKHGFTPFAIYRVIAGIVLIMWDR